MLNTLGLTSTVHLSIFIVLASQQRNAPDNALDFDNGGNESNEEFLSAAGGSQISQASSQNLQIDEDNANEGNDPDEETFRPRTAGAKNIF